MADRTRSTTWHTPGRARAAISAQFLTNAILIASLFPRLPEIKDAFGLSDAAFGLVVIAMPVGALVAAPAGGKVIRALGAPRVLSVGTALLAAAVAGAAASPAVVFFVGCFALVGAADSLVDAAQNVQGLMIQRWLGRSIINSLHAVWSLGAAAGGALGAWAAGAGVDVATQMVVSGLVWSGLAVVTAWLAVVPDDAGRARQTDQTGVGQPPSADTEAPLPDGAGRARSIPRTLALLAALAICGTLIEDIANNWVTLYLHRDIGLPISIAGLGLAAMLLAQAVGRLAGDPITDRIGAARQARVGGGLILGGMAVALVASAPAAVFAGFVSAGLGCATLVPAAFAAADEIPGLQHGTGVALVGWLMRLGFVITSPLVGAVSAATSLRTAMGVPMLAGLVALLISHGRVRQERAGP